MNNRIPFLHHRYFLNCSVTKCFTHAPQLRRAWIESLLLLVYLTVLSRVSLRKKNGAVHASHHLISSSHQTDENPFLKSLGVCTKLSRNEKLRPTSWGLFPFYLHACMRIRHVGPMRDKWWSWLSFHSFMSSLILTPGNLRIDQNHMKLSSWFSRRLIRYTIYSYKKN